MKIVNLFNSKSKGTCDDFFDVKKYKNISQAYEENDFVKCDFVTDSNEITYIKLTHQKTNETKLYQLQWQDPRFGLDAHDDNEMCRLAGELLDNKESE
jgi:hypothetical protein